MPPQNVRIRDDNQGTVGITAVGAYGALKVDVVQSVFANASSLTASSPTSSSVTIVSASVLAANASRKGLVFTNVGGNWIYLGLGVAAQTGKGIALSPFGSWTMNEFTFFTGQIFAISDSGSDLAIQEFS